MVVIDTQTLRSFSANRALTILLLLHLLYAFECNSVTADCGTLAHFSNDTIVICRTIGCFLGLFLWVILNLLISRFGVREASEGVFMRHLQA